ncbi:MAG: GNAT family N-acetyltransferase [Alphaproteobacteria bacterium]|nr:MAG: GNAT family N-acetyltransferase [Alphaproteobacteria bacterium]
MNQDINISTNKILKTGPMKKSGGQYALVLLQPKDIPQMMGLQDVAFAALTPEQQTYLHHKTPEFLNKHFAHGNIVLGVVADGKLVAQSVVVNPTRLYPDTGMTDMKLDVEPEKITTIQGVIVDPAARGNNLMTVMVDEWLAIAKKEGRTHAVAEVTVQNHHSWSVFMKEGLQIHSIGHDGTDNSDVYNMHASVTHLINRRAKPDFNKAAAPKSATCHMSQLLHQKALLRKGYVGVSFNAANQNICFRAPRKKQFKPGGV